MGLPQVILFDWLPYKMMLEIIAACDVGLAPLMNVPFNEQKSELKLLEYALCSTPFLASPLPSYVRLLSEIGDGEEGCGFLCRTPEDWEGWLERLYEDQDLLQAMAERCRAKIAPYRIKEKAHLWEEAYLEGLAQIRHGSGRLRNLGGLNG
jgi:glycosyltransferase involved in cell wall biosynthesis